ncbi:SDR family oxidoreductase [Sphingomonas crocodyli]|uniref:SDR family oxidoreductase n=1 Tax=Sphingomonas crocodyli TaxID=1979270 RepID=A0A437M021_9SPHN|nr:SDR family oxidoreductase [Sphingomonas crocodyli]RVT91027.1 SDR family oxidoreductase [Sphingomonas crocodyli]
MTAIEGSVAIVTGGASGIGLGSAGALSRAGAKLVVADIDGDGAERAAAGLSGEAIGIACDVTQEDAFDRLKAAAIDRFGRVDIVMNNAGVLTRGLPDHIPFDEWRRVIDTNLMSIVRSNLVFVPHLIAQGSGHIVNTASFGGLYTYAFDRIPYAASKAAVVQMSEALWLYLKPQGVGVTCLCPGPVKTNIARGLKTFGPPIETRGPHAGFPLLEPDVVGQMVVDAILADRFMLPTDEGITDLLVDRARDWDGFLAKEADRAG